MASILSRPQWVKDLTLLQAIPIHIIDIDSLPNHNCMNDLIPLYQEKMMLVNVHNVHVKEYHHEELLKIVQ